MSCKYCNNKPTFDKELERVYVDKYIYNDNEDDSKDLYQRIFITDNKLRVEIDKFEYNFDGYCDEDSYRIETKINYCPMCGRKLEDKQEVAKWVSNYRLKKLTYYDRVLEERRTVYDVYICGYFSSCIKIFTEDEDFVIRIEDIISVEK